MSDGKPYQCSHFKQNTVYAIMQPAISSGNTFYPYFFKSPDRNMFDAIGWDYLLSYALTTNASGAGSVDRNPDLPAYLPATEVELTASPDPGYMFDHWSGDLSGNNNPDTILMDSDKTITAFFLTLNCTLTVNVDGNGAVVKNPDSPFYPRNSAVELTAVPDSGWRFDHWGGNLWGSQSPDTIIMNGDKTVTAYFLEDGYVEEDQAEKMQVTFLDVYPNPFSEKIEIKFSVGRSAKSVELKIYDVTGQLIRDFSINQLTNQLVNKIIWDGRDDAGEKVSSGIYFLKFSTENCREIKKLLLLR